MNSIGKHHIRRTTMGALEKKLCLGIILLFILVKRYEENKNIAKNRASAGKMYKKIKKDNI